MRNMPLLTVKTNSFGERYFVEFSGRIFEKSSSKTVFERYFKDAFDTEHQLYLIVGTDSGLLPQYLRDRFASPNHPRKGRRFVFFEQREVIQALEALDLPEWIEIRAQDSDLNQLSSEWIEYMMTKRIGLYKSIAVIDEVSGNQKTMWASIKDQYTKLRFSDMANNHTRPFVEAQLKNFPRNNVQISKFQNALKGKKAIMIGGGPSLDGLLDWIKSVRDQFFIFAVGRVSKKLHQEGLTPDFIVSVDPHELSYDNSKQMFYFAEESILLNCYHIAPRLLSQWAGLSCYFGELYPWEEASGNSTSPGPTVLHSAVVQAAYLGCNEIYLAGVDLCFYKGKTHASGSAEAEIGQLSIKDTSTVETYSGELAETDIPFAQGVVQLGNIAQYLKNTREISLYNLSELAAKVVNVELKLPSEIVLLGEQEQKRACLDSLKAQMGLSRKEVYKILKDKLKLMQKERRLIVEAQKHLKDALKSIEKYKKDFSDKSLIQAQNIRFKLEKHLKEQAQMLFYYGYPYFSEVMKPVEDKNQLSNEEIAHTLAAYFEGMKKSARDFLVLLDIVLDDIHFMLLEFATDSKPCELVDTWYKKSESGRSEVWSQYHDEDLNDVEHECLNKARKAFAEDVAAAQTRQAKLLKSRAFSVANLIEKIKHAFEAQKIEELVGLKDKVKELKNPIDKEGLEGFIEGAILAIESPGKEVEIFEGVSHPKLNVYLKSRLLPYYTKNENHEKALETLQLLCEYSDDYLIPYADYLNILGRPELAAEVALTLFRKEPNNLPALLKVVHFSYAAGLGDLFDDALEVASSMDANHPELQRYLH